MSETDVDVLVNQVLKALEHPAYLLEHVTCVDSKSGEKFDFQVTNPDSGWYWQREVLDHWMGQTKWIGLKARQLGITWLAAGYGLWTVLTKPGTRVLVISTNEEEASKVVNRIWDMLESLPPHLRFNTRVLKPARGARPFRTIELQHPDGSVSSIVGLPSTKKAGHGETAAVVILDEFARQDYARDTWKAVIPTMADGGRVIVISTANGVSNDLTGEGNFYHHLWTNAREYGVSTHFLGWDKHPDRDQAWYDGLSLPPKDKAEQYPANPEEAFILTGDLFFDPEALAWYQKEATRDPEYRADFVRVSGNKAKLIKRVDGKLAVFEEPIAGHDYALAADVATGRGTDFSAAYVVDLSNGKFVAELRGKISPDLYAYQLHYLGRWYNTARIAVEMGGGYGEPVVLELRNPRDGKPMYPRLYRHHQEDRPDSPEAKPYGFPMNQKTRPLVINQLESWIRDHSLPHLTRDLLRECLTFVHAKTNPSPRAQDGCNDDCVMAAAIALEMYRQYGSHPDKRKKRRVRKQLVPEYPWL